jgi:hypothetical protein
MNYKNYILKISSDLNLQYEVQDWGVINSSGHRLLEFINYLNNHTFPDFVQCELLELIIASFNDSLIENICNKNDIDSFQEVIIKHEASCISVINYWKKIYNEEDFPAGGFLSPRQSEH